MNRIHLLNLGALILAAGLQAQPVTAETDPVGFVNVSVPAQSDAILAVPLNRAPVFQGMVDSINVGTNTITLKGTPGFTANQFVFGVPTAAQTNTYAVQIATGTKEGLIAKVTANGTNTLTLQLDAGDDLTGIVGDADDSVADSDGDQITVMPYWTPASLITSPPLATAILGFNTSGAGIDRGPAEIYAFDGTNWQDDVNGGAPVNHIALPFGTSFVLRNNSAAQYSFSMVGSVPMTKFRVRIATQLANTTQDINIGYLCPIPESLISLEFPAVAGDSILGFDNTELGIDKGPISIYAYDGTKWVDDVNGGDVPATVKLQPGIGYIFRKNQTATPQTLLWTHIPSYLD
jgi:uncharacterized protein (TIGR02597 family)